MNKILVAGIGAIGAAAATLALGVGVASADDGVVGKKYSEAQATLSEQGVTPVVATTIGGRTGLDDCIVTSATPAPAVDGFGNQASGKMNVNLNCNVKS